MKDLEVITDTVADWSKNADADTVLHLSGGRQLIVRADNPHSTVWLRALSLLKQNHWPAYIEYEADTHVVRQLLMCTPREVKELRPQGLRRHHRYLSTLRRTTYCARTNPILTRSWPFSPLQRKAHGRTVAVHPTTLEISALRGQKITDRKRA